MAKPGQDVGPGHQHVSAQDGISGLITVGSTPEGNLCGPCLLCRSQPREERPSQKRLHGQGPLSQDVMTSGTSPGKQVPLLWHGGLTCCPQSLCGARCSRGPPGSCARALEPGGRASSPSCYRNPCSPLLGSVILGRFLHCGESQFPHLKARCFPRTPL